MKQQELEAVLRRVNGATFAAIDSKTSPSEGLTKIKTGENVLLFSNKKGSSYERMVHKRLQSIGKDPTTFKVGDLPWGKRIYGTPLIRHNNGRLYLQAIIIGEGEERFFIRGVEISRPNWLRKCAPSNQGLPHDKAVKVRCYSLDSIEAIRIFGNEYPQPKMPLAS